MVNIKINGKPVVVEPGKRIIEITDHLQIHIPRFCYHEKLSVVANCRMCLVEIVGAKKLSPACSTYVSEGMEVLTNSSKTIESQKSIMELLLANHPLDCPICVQAGECELQDLSLKFGASRSRYKEPKRVVLDQDVGSLIATNMTRCIHCTRCVRFSNEISGDMEIAAIGKGECMRIATFPGETINSELSGNMIDLCPVGALIAKPFSYTGRSWQFKQVAGVASHDCIGSNIYYHVFNQQIKRIMPNNDNSHKEEYIWLSDRDRFGFMGINATDRLKHPLLKKNNKWSIITWAEAVSFIYSKLKAVLDKYGSSQIGGLLWPNATTEEYCFIKKFFDNLGSSNLDYRLRQLDFRWLAGIPFTPNLGMKQVSDLAQQKGVLLIGCHIHKEHPVVGTYLRSATLAGSKIIVINPIDFKFNFELYQKHIVPFGNILLPLIEITRIILNIKPKDLNPKIKELLLFIEQALEQAGLEKIITSDIEETKFDDSNTYFLTAKALLDNNDKFSIILGLLATTHPEYSIILMITHLICLLTDNTIGCFSDGANSVGACLAGCLSVNNHSLNAREMLQIPLKAYFLLGIEPELDCAEGLRVTKSLKQADLVVALSCFESNLLLNNCDIVLPMAAPQESCGTYINITNNWKKFEAAVPPTGESKPVTEIISMLAKSFGWDFANFDLNQTIIDKCKDNVFLQDLSVGMINNVDYNNPKDLINFNSINEQKINVLIRIMPLCLYSTDPIVRRAECLQKTKDASLEAVINEKYANKLSLYNGEIVSIRCYDHPHTIIKLPIKINNIVADGCILINQVNIKTLVGTSYSKIMIEKIYPEKT
jgi:NADH-quinone oxidoreductase subunit G